MGKEMLRKGPGAKKVRELLSNYVLALKNEYSSGLILPKKDQAAPPVKTTAVSKPASKLAGGQANEASMKALDLGCKLDLAEVKLEETISALGRSSTMLSRGRT